MNWLLLDYIKVYEKKRVVLWNSLDEIFATKIKKYRKWNKTKTISTF